MFKLKWQLGIGLVVLLGILVVGLAQQRGGRLRKIIERRQESKQSSGEQLKEMQAGGAKRTYQVHLPRGYDGSQRLPLVLVFHGGGGNAQNAAQMTGFSAKADQENFVVVYPNGSGRFDKLLLTWNALGCCDYAMEQRVDDVQFVRLLIERLVRDYAIDERRIYATGFSNGALLSHLLAAQMPEKLAAIAPVAGAIFDATPMPKGMMPVLMIHGMADTAVAFAGGISSRQRVNQAQSAPYKSVAYTADYWAKQNRCQSQPRQQSKGKIVTTTYASCAGSNEVQVLAITDGLHAWPGGKKGRDAADEPSKVLNATDAIWDFFKNHPKR